MKQHNISLNPLYDPWRIKELLTKDHIYIQCYRTDDLYSQPIDFLNTMWLEIKQDDNTVGLGIIKEFAEKCLVFHGGIYKDYRPNTVSIMTECLQQLKKSGCELITTIQKDNIKAVKLMSKLNYKNVFTIGNTLVFAENK